MSTNVLTGYRAFRKLVFQRKEGSYQQDEVFREMLILHMEKPVRAAPLGVSRAWQDRETDGHQQS